MSVLDDVVTVIKAAGMQRAYSIGSVPASPTYPYAVVGVDTGTPGLRRAGGGATKKDRRVTVQLFGRSDDAVLDYARLADLALEDKVIGALPGRPFSYRELQTPIYRDPDDQGVLNILHTYKLLEA